MNKKTILIGLGVLAVAGIGYYMWKKKSENNSTNIIKLDGSSSANKELSNMDKNNTSNTEKYVVTKTNKYTSPPFKVGDVFEGTSDKDGYVQSSSIMFEGKLKTFQFVLGDDVKKYTK
jgi:hypothetical protein